LVTDAFTTIRALKAAYQSDRVKAVLESSKLSDTEPQDRVEAILYMMTGIKPERLDAEKFHKRLAEVAKDGKRNPLRYSPTIVCTSSDQAIRPIIYATDHESYLLLQYYTDEASKARGLIGKSMTAEELKHSFSWAVHQPPSL
jgi:hypothetical protein